MPYCTPADITLGMDMPRGVDVQEVINSQAMSMDGTIGMRYRLPLNLDANDPEQMPYVYLLRKMNIYAAKGTILLDAAGARQDESTSAWARYYLRWVDVELNKIAKGVTDIPGQDPAREESTDGSLAPIILNKDTFSRVDAFYAVDQNVPPWQGTRQEASPWE